MTVALPCPICGSWFRLDGVYLAQLALGGVVAHQPGLALTLRCRDCTPPDEPRVVRHPVGALPGLRGRRIEAMLRAEDRMSDLRVAALNRLYTDPASTEEQERLLGKINLWQHARRLRLRRLLGLEVE